MDNYNLENLYKNSQKRKYCENLYYLELLEKAFQSTEITLPTSVFAADVGTADWFYVRAYYTFLKWWNCEFGRDVFLRGYELDAYRVYNDLYSRMDYSLMYSGDL
ncbi:MAG: hypothetical protein MUO76_12435 [Anaerolineaceae bacterium]|nr:hypothetical protein [Anaerolineaceae bacterium]